MAAYDKNRMPFTPELQRRTRVALKSFFMALVTGDTEQLAQLLRADVLELKDGAGQYFAARVPLIGRERVILFNQRLIQIRGLPAKIEVRVVNAMPAYLITFAHSVHRDPPRALVTSTLDSEGQIAAFFAVIADATLSQLTF